MLYLLYRRGAIMSCLLYLAAMMNRHASDEQENFA